MVKQLSRGRTIFVIRETLMEMHLGSAIFVK